MSSSGATGKIPDGEREKVYEKAFAEIEKHKSEAALQGKKGESNTVKAAVKNAWTSVKAFFGNNAAKEKLAQQKLAARFLEENKGKSPTLISRWTKASIIEQDKGDSKKQITVQLKDAKISFSPVQVVSSRDKLAKAKQDLHARSHFDQRDSRQVDTDLTLNGKQGDFKICKGGEEGKDFYIVYKKRLGQGVVAGDFVMTRKILFNEQDGSLSIQDESGEKVCERC